MFSMFRAKPNAEKGVHRQWDGRQGLRSYIHSGISQATNGVYSTVALEGLAFVSFLNDLCCTLFWTLCNRPAGKPAKTELQSSRREVNKSATSLALVLGKMMSNRRKAFYFKNGGTTDTAYLIMLERIRSVKHGGISLKV